MKDSFKKLAAIVLAGVMALAVLTGCSDSDKTTFHKQLTDALSDAKVTAEYNTADVAKAEKIAQLWDSYAAEIKSIEKKQAEGKYDTTADYQDARDAALDKVYTAATLVGGEYYGFVTVQEKDADTIASIVSVLKARALLSTVIPILVPRPLLRKRSVALSLRASSSFWFTRSNQRPIA